MDKNLYSGVLSNINLSAKLLIACLMVIVSAIPSVWAQTYSGKSNSLKIQIKDPNEVEKTIKPDIKWVYPIDTQQVINKELVNLKLGINSKSPLIKVTLIVNNEVIEVFSSFASPAPGSGYLFDAWLERPVQLEQGENDIQLIVQNEQGALKHQRKIEVAIEPSLRRDYALIFGTDEYNSWETLDGPVRDAERIAKELELKGFNIELVRNASTFELLDKLENYAKRDFDPYDQLFIYIAGHGYFHSTTGEGFLVCKNSIKLPGANATYISYKVLKSIVNNIPAQHIFLLLDVVKGKGEPLPMALTRQIAEQENGTFSLPETDEIGKTRMGIISGTESYEWSGRTSGSPISSAFLSYLRKSEQPERVTWTELMEEFQFIEPTPIYIEFGDHSAGRGFSFQQATQDN